MSHLPVENYFLNTVIALRPLCLAYMRHDIFLYREMVIPLFDFLTAYSHSLHLERGLLSIQTLMISSQSQFALNF